MNSQLVNNRYQILKKLGEGGFGTTYLAEDTQMPSRRRCVIKQLKPLAHDPRIYQLIGERFQREAAILEDLGQKNEQIPQLYAYGEEQGQFYLVQEYIDGETLSTKVGNRGVLGDAAVRDILLKLLAVLVYVHDHRIVHRDIKPDNIILRRGDELPVLIDFGAVKETMGTVMTAAGNPTSSIVIGTPGFMPSEQSIGRPVYATDLYALGLTAIYLLTGKVPQELATDPLTGEIQWRDHAPGVSPSLALVLDKAIKSHYQERFPTAQAMQEALAPSSSRSTVLLPPSPPSTAVHPPAPQSRGGDWLKFGIVGGVMGLVLLAGFVYLQDQQQKAFEERLNQLQRQSPPGSPSPQPSPPASPESAPEASPENAPEASPENAPTVRVPSPYLPSPQPSPVELSPTPTPTPSRIEPEPSTSPYLDQADAISTVENLYYLVSNRQYDQAVQLFSPQLANQFNPKFFNQFERVTVENLQITSRTDAMINLRGENTYVYPDGTTQRELRSYTVRKTDQGSEIAASDFIKVIKFR